ncbi:MAG: BACON domain-containing protein, partial [Prevotellaceae bacterium]|nr:BACON domain-containing protein [Prevotellaceae bacterium]
MKKICMWLAVASLAVIAACQNDQNGNVELLISADTLNVSGNGGTAFVTVFINGSAHWSVAGGAEWCSLNRTSGDGFGEGDGDTVRITVAENPSFEEPRNAVFTFTAGNAVHAVTVEQEALNSLLTIPTNNTSIVLPAKDTTITLFVESNLDTWTATSNREWCVISPPLSGSGNGTLTVHLNANPELYQRSGMVTLTSGTVKLNKPISQTPGGEYPATTVWKVLWVICPAMDVVYNGKPYKTFMTADEIELVKQKAPWYEEFIEEHTHGALDIEITIEVLRDTVTSLHGGEGPKMSVAERTR